MRPIVCLALIGLMALYVFEPRPLTHAFEDLTLAFTSEPGRVMEYANHHFNATNADEYDFARAEHLYRKAEAMDATYPALQHQLARIEFLRENFSSGLTHINREIAVHGETNPNAYYVRALILGYMGRYLEAASDYETYFQKAPANWAGINDYSWVLLKAELPEGALAALEWGLREWPENPWLLHNKVIALYELERYEEALGTAEAASKAVAGVTESDWLTAYPGNNPAAAAQGLASFKQAVYENQQKALKRVRD